MTTVRIVPARHIRPPRGPDGSDVPGWWPHQRLVVLADDAGHRAVPLYNTVWRWSRRYGPGTAQAAASAPSPATSASTAAGSKRIIDRAT